MSESFLDLQLAIDSHGFLPEKALFENWVRHTLLAVEEDVRGVIVRIVEQSEMTTLNNQFRQKNKVTNVLSFPFEDIEGVDYHHLGDIVICANVVEQEAKTQRKPVDAHWAHLVIHGTLHLCGFDHQEEYEAQEMEEVERKIMAELDYPNPYNDSLSHCVLR